jgi:hypothetical protein
LEEEDEEDEVDQEAESCVVAGVHFQVASAGNSPEIATICD